MARLFPLRSDTPAQEGQPRVVDLADEDADAVFGALSSTTARRIYATIDDEPGTPSDIAETIDSSIQNVRYHLEKLEDAGLVEVVDTWYSSRGNEMSVYATADGPLIVTSDESKAAQLKTALSRFIGGIGALAGGSLLVQYGLERFVANAGTPSGTEDEPASGNGDAEYASSGDRDEADETEDSASSEAEDAEDSADAETRDAGESESAGDDATADPEPETDDGGFGIAQEDEAEDDAPEGDTETNDAADAPDSEPTSADGANETNDSVADVVDANDTGADTVPDGSAEAADAVLATVPPGLLFFLGGLVVLIAVTLYWYWSTY